MDEYIKLKFKIDDLYADMLWNNESKIHISESEDYPEVLNKTIGELNYILSSDRYNGYFYTNPKFYRVIRLLITQCGNLSKGIEPCISIDYSKECVSKDIGKLNICSQKYSKSMCYKLDKLYELVIKHIQDDKVPRQIDGMLNTILVSQEDVDIKMLSNKLVGFNLMDSSKADILYHNIKYLLKLEPAIERYPTTIIEMNSNLQALVEFVLNSMPKSLLQECNTYNDKVKAAIDYANLNK